MPPLGTCCYQAVNWKGRDYLLTRLGFGLASAPKIMSAIVEKCVEKVPHVCSSYTDDIFVVGEQNCGEEMRSHLKKWGLTTKEAESIESKSTVRVLGLEVDSQLKWIRGGTIEEPGEQRMTKR